jgi:hypothetical protein
MMDAIVKLKMNSNKYPKEQREIMYINPNGYGIEARAYFLFKFSIENDRRYAFEKLENFTNFDEYLPISKL